MSEKQPRHEHQFNYRRLSKALVVMALLVSCSDGESRQPVEVFSQEALRILATAPPDLTLIGPSFFESPATPHNTPHHLPDWPKTLTPSPTETLEPTPPPPTPASEPTPTTIPEPTRTYTEQFYFDLAQFPGLDFNNETTSFAFDFNLPATEGKSVSFTIHPVAYNEYTGIDTYLENAAPGLKKAGLKIDRYGNIQLELHSGQKGGQDLEAESLRQLAEGTGVPADLTLEQAQELQKALENLLRGTSVSIKQEDEPEQQFVVDTVGYVPQQYIGGDDTLYILRILYPLIDENGIVEKDEYDLPRSKFDEYTDPENRALMLFFCGRTTDRQAHPNDWFTWGRWIIFLRPAP